MLVPIGKTAARQSLQGYVVVDLNPEVAEHMGFRPSHRQSSSNSRFVTLLRVLREECWPTFIKGSVPQVFIPHARWLFRDPSTQWQADQEVYWVESHRKFTLNVEVALMPPPLPRAPLLASTAQRGLGRAAANDLRSSGKPHGPTTSWRTPITDPRRHHKLVLRSAGHPSIFQ